MLSPRAKCRLLKDSRLARRANHFVLSKTTSFDVKPHLQKYSTSVFRKIMIVSPDPASFERGVSRSSRTLEAGCDGREGVQRALARRRKHSSRTSEIVRSRRPDAGVNPRVTSPGGMVANKPGTPGRPRISRKPSRRGCRLIWLPCCCLRAQSALFFARKAHGCGLHPAFPAPSSLRGSRLLHHPATLVPRECGVVCALRHCERSDEAIQTISAAALWIASLRSQ